MEVTSRRDGAAAVGPCAGIPAEHMDFIRQVLDRVGDKWSLLLIAVMESGPLRYTDLQRQVPESPSGCSPSRCASYRRTV